jgi:hypothetical protein
MKLFVDDIRNPPDNTWTVARNYYEAIEYLSGAEQITAISLDHDLGIGTPTGYDIAKWIEKKAVEGKFILPKCLRCHSQNPVGKRNILIALEQAKKYNSR